MSACTQGSLLQPHGQPYSFNLCEIENLSFHCHDDFEFVWVIEGQISVDVIYEQFSLSSGDLLLIDKGELHKMSGDKGKNLVALINFSSDFAASHSNNLTIPYICEWISQNRQGSGKINELKRKLLRLSPDDTLYRSGLTAEDSGDDCAGDINTSFMRFMNRNFTVVSYYNDKCGEIPECQIQYVYRAIDYISRHHTEKISLKEIADIINIEKTYLSHLTKDISTFTVSEHIEYFRVETAVKLLLRTDLSNMQISEHSGFSDTKYFYKGLDKWYHRTPYELRKLYSKDRIPELKKIQ